MARDTITQSPTVDVLTIPRCVSSEINCPAAKTPSLGDPVDPEHCSLLTTQCRQLAEQQMMPYLPGDPYSPPTSEKKTPQSNILVQTLQRPSKETEASGIDQGNKSSSGPCSQCSTTSPRSCPHNCLDTNVPSMQTSGLQRDRGTPPTSTQSCRRIGLVVPEALIGKSDFKYHFN